MNGKRATEIIDISTSPGESPFGYERIPNCLLTMPKPAGLSVQHWWAFLLVLADAMWRKPEWIFRRKRMASICGCRLDTMSARTREWEKAGLWSREQTNETRRSASGINYRPVFQRINDELARNGLEPWFELDTRPEFIEHQVARMMLDKASKGGERLGEIPGGFLILGRPILDESAVSPRARIIAGWMLNRIAIGDLTVDRVKEFFSLEDAGWRSVAEELTAHRAFCRRKTSTGRTWTWRYEISRDPFDLAAAERFARAQPSDGKPYTRSQVIDSVVVYGKASHGKASDGSSACGISVHVVKSADKTINTKQSPAEGGCPREREKAAQDFAALRAGEGKNKKYSRNPEGEGARPEIPEEELGKGESQADPEQAWLDRLKSERQRDFAWGLFASMPLYGSVGGRSLEGQLPRGKILDRNRRIQLGQALFEARDPVGMLRRMHPRHGGQGFDPRSLSDLARPGERWDQLAERVRAARKEQGN